MANPGDQFPPGDDYLARQNKKLQRQIDENASARSLEAAQVGEGGIHITSGGSLTVDGGGTIILNGISLASLIAGSVTSQTNSASTTGFTLTTSYSSQAGFNFFVPAGFTRVSIMAVGTLASTSASSTDFLRVRVTVNGAAGAEVGVQFGTPNIPAVTAVASASLTGLTAGQALPVIIQGYLQLGAGSTFNTYSSVTASATFLV